MTAATSRETFQRAGQLGANVLTHLFDQRVDELAARISIYRQAREQAGLDPEAGQVTVTVPTFIAPTIEQVREHAQAPYCQYLKSNFALLKSLAVSRGIDVDVTQLDDRQLDQMLDYLFEKFMNGRSLLGTPAACRDVLVQLAGVGASEVACLLDFGLPASTILEHLPQLAELALPVAVAS